MTDSVKAHFSNWAHGRHALESKAEFHTFIHIQAFTKHITDAENPEI